jgi:poly(A) polymerase Pap1
MRGRKVVSEQVSVRKWWPLKGPVSRTEVTGEETRQQQSLIQRVEWGRNEETKERERKCRRTAYTGPNALVREPNDANI